MVLDEGGGQACSFEKRRNKTMWGGCGVWAAEDNDAGGSEAAADSVPLTHISPRGSPVPGWVGW